MKDISSLDKSKHVITGNCINKESVYYTALFGAAFIVSIVLMVIAIIQENRGLKIYSAFLIPAFLICTAIAARFACISKNKIYMKSGNLVIKSFFITRKFKMSNIKKLTSAQFGKEGLTSIKINYCNKTFKYTFKNITKDDTAIIKRAISNS